MTPETRPAIQSLVSGFDAERPLIGQTESPRLGMHKLFNDLQTLQSAVDKNKPEQVSESLAHVLIRVSRMANYYGIDLEEAVVNNLATQEKTVPKSAYQAGEGIVFHAQYGNGHMLQEAPQPPQTPRERWQAARRQQLSRMIR